MPLRAVPLALLVVLSGARAAPDASALARGDAPIRVLLLDTTGEAAVTCEGGLVILAGDGAELSRPGASATIARARGSGLTSEGAATGVPTLAVRAAEGGALSVSVRAAPGAKPSFTSSQRGELRFSLTPAGKLRIVCALAIDDYLTGVIGHEIGDDVPAAALEAQAVASRSYAIAGALRTSGSEWDMTSDTRSQVYRGEAEVAAAVRSAVEATRGQVLLCAGEVVRAVYHSCCGGSTADSSDIWGGPIAGACPVVDGALSAGDLAEESALRSFLLNASPALYCSSDRGEFRWRRRFTADALTRALSGKGIGRVQDVRVTSRAHSGHVKVLEVIGAKGSVRFSGDAIRWSLGSDSVPSTLFAIERAGERPHSAYEFFGGGAGHGVGMCQAGAIAMARAGADCRTVLSRYYRDATLTVLGGAP